MKYDEMKKILFLLSDPSQKLEMLMEFGKSMPPVPQNAKCHEIQGCSSFAQICIDKKNHFYGSADSALVRGIVAIITAMVDGKTKEEIKKMDIAAEFKSLNLNLGAARLNGINSMIRFLQNL